MSISIACPSCGKGLKAPESAAGKRAKCPACGQVIAIPDNLEVLQEVEQTPRKSAAPPRTIAPPPLSIEQPAAARVYPPATGVGERAENRRACPMCGETIVATAVKCRFCGEVFNSLLRKNGIGRSYSPQLAELPYTESGFNNLYLWFAILLGLGLPALFIVIGVFMLIAAWVLQYILLYRCWNVIQDGHARTTPGKAVGFLFIPFFNFYWMFVAIHGLAQDMESYCRRRSLPCAVNPTRALAFCILVLCSIIPLLGIVAVLVNLLIILVLWHQFKTTAVTILRYHQSHPRSAAGAVVLT